VIDTPFSSRPPRPAAWAAAAVAAGSGAVLLDGAPRLAIALAAAGLLALAGRRCPRGALALVVLAVVAAVRAADARPEWNAAVWNGARERTSALSGRWRVHDPSYPSSRGWLEDEGGARVAGLGVEFLGPPPRAGERVWIAAGGEIVPEPRGPVARPVGLGPPPGPTTRVLPDEFARLPTRGASTPWADRVAGLRHSMLARLSERLPDSVSGLYRALVLGDRSALSRDETDLFTRTGTRHLLSVSGLHAGLVAWLFLAPWARFGRRAGRPWRVALVTVALLAAYVPLTGSAPPVTRAAVALAFVAAAPLWRRRPDSISLLSLALLWEVSRDPLALGRVSVQLSYAATAGLLLLTGPIERRLRGERQSGAEVETSLGPEPHPLVAALRRRGARLARRALAASLAATLATLPILWWTFGELGLTGPALTPWLVPLLAVLLAVGWSAWLLPFALPEVVATAPVEALRFCLRVADSLPGTPLVLPERPGWAVFGAVALTTAWVWQARAGRRAGGPGDPGDRGASGETSHFGRGVALAWGLLLLPWTALPRAVEIHALDVGHGTCVALRGPGEPGWVFDAGSRDRKRIGKSALLPLLRRWEVGRLDLVLSHADRDHTGEADWLVDRFPPRSISGALPAQVAERLPHDVLRFDLPRGGLSLPGASRGRGPLQARLLRGAPLPGNEGSRSLLVRAGSANVLLTGDAEGPGLFPLLESGEIPPDLRLLLLPHHGSDGPAVASALDRWRPRETWVSGSGRPALGPELDRRGWTWFHTGIHGPLALFLRQGPPDESSTLTPTCSFEPHSSVSLSPSPRPPSAGTRIPRPRPPRGSSTRNGPRASPTGSWSFPAGTCCAPARAGTGTTGSFARAPPGPPCRRRPW